jgi:hypothetical protein
MVNAPTTSAVCRTGAWPVQRGESRKLGLHELVDEQPEVERDKACEEVSGKAPRDVSFEGREDQYCHHEPGLTLAELA